MWEWLGEPEAFADSHWETFLARLKNADVLNALYTEHFASMTMDEVCRGAAPRHRVHAGAAPRGGARERALLSRGTFVEAELAPGVRGPVASGFYELDGERLGPEARAAARRAHGRGSDAVMPTRAGAPPAALLPLAGLRVLDFGIGGVGVEAGRMFAEYGADVIKIESRSYPDFIRTVLGGEMSPSFASSSRSKRSFGVNLKRPGGFALLQRLIEAPT